MPELNLDHVRENIEDWEQGMGSVGVLTDRARQLLDVVERVLELAKTVESVAPHIAYGIRLAVYGDDGA